MGRFGDTGGGVPPGGRGVAVQSCGSVLNLLIKLSKDDGLFGESVLMTNFNLYDGPETSAPT